ncbi:MmgE/PrpD family protein [Methylobacterium indicum]|uniref:MmgE/PrpD family protein n=1 Tax=Methylobacterium indicum TaxID=1775910 RepID=UPI000A99029D|nr:MmgE/PrpD family protein [Methylobacterium indicum]
MPPATLQLARTFSALSWAEIPAPVRHETERLLLDTLGCLLAGAETEIGPMARRFGLALGGGTPVFVAGGPRLGLLGAIYANARIANALDLDETFPVGAHFGVGAVAAALGLAEARMQSGAAFLSAILIGYELGARLASQIGPMIEVEDGRVTGFPSVWGVAAPVVLAAGGAAARLLEQDPALFAQSLGLASANTPVPVGAHWAAAIDLPNAKYCDAGWCAVTGAGGALAAEAGTRGFPTILDGPSSLARLSGAASPNESYLTAGLGERWLIADITYKPWPSCRFTHPVLTALEAILASERPAIDAITAIVVETGPLTASARFTQATPRTFASRQFSFPHLIAMRLLGVPPGPAWCDPRWDDDPAVAVLRAKVRFEAHPRGEDFVHSLTRNQMRTLPGGIRLHLVDGRSLRAESDTARGDPWDPETLLSDEALAEKLRGLARGPVEPLIEAVGDLSRATSIKPLIAALQAAGGMH